MLAKQGVCEIYCGQRVAGLQAIEEALQKEPQFPELLDVVAAGAALAQTGNVLGFVVKQGMRLAANRSHLWLARCFCHHACSIRPAVRS